MDLLIRTSGESRLSDFLLWQCATAQLAFVPALWPDFGYLDLVGAIVDFQLGHPAMQVRSLPQQAWHAARTPGCPAPACSWDQWSAWSDQGHWQPARKEHASAQALLDLCRLLGGSGSQSARPRTRSSCPAERAAAVRMLQAMRARCLGREAWPTARPSNSRRACGLAWLQLLRGSGCRVHICVGRAARADRDWW